MNTLFRDLHHHPENPQFKILSGALLPQPASTTWLPVSFQHGSDIEDSSRN